MAGKGGKIKGQGRKPGHGAEDGTKLKALRAQDYVQQNAIPWEAMIALHNAFIEGHGTAVVAWDDDENWFIDYPQPEVPTSMADKHRSMEFLWNRGFGMAPQQITLDQHITTTVTMPSFAALPADALLFFAKAQALLTSPDDQPEPLTELPTSTVHDEGDDDGGVDGVEAAKPGQNEAPPTPLDDIPDAELVE